MKVIYRISDVGYKKEKPEWINNEHCLRNAWVMLNNSDFIIVMDNVSDKTRKMILSVTNNTATYHSVSLGSSAQTFNYALDLALDLPNDEIVYFLENDYIHTSTAETVIIDGVNMGFDYVTGYDHPDKYISANKGGNPLCSDNSEETRLYCGQHSHYKWTNSTTMTFAAKVSTLKRDEVMLRKWTTGNHPHDFQMFMELRERGRKLVSSVPAVSTHGETKFLSPLVDWEGLVWNN
jgi:hypothetical protein